MKNVAELTLDPTNWDDMRKLGHRMIDDMVNHLSNLNDKPAWQPMPQDVKSGLREPLPLKGQGEQVVYEQFLTNILPYPVGNLHPRFYGWVNGTGVPLGMFADMLASGLNPNMAGFNQAPMVVELQALEWMAEMMGMPSGTSGLFVSGASMANVLGLAVARHAKAGFDVRSEGLQSEHEILTVYCSTETHSWAKKAMQFLGFGSRYLRAIEVGDDFRIDIQKLQTAIREDRAKGYRPICVIGTAGTVNTGATDDFDAIADVCAKEDLWFHIDGAFGALVHLSDEYRNTVKGMQRADSLAFDLHKWMCLPYEVACVLVKDAKTHRDTFVTAATYLAAADRGTAVNSTVFADRGIELSRSFKALKVWMCLKAYGVKKFAALIEQNIRQVQYLKALVENNPELELLAPAPLNILCFRYFVAGMENDALNALNQEILLRLQESGIAAPSNAMIGGRYAIRVANVNHRATMEDFKILADAVTKFGREVTEETTQLTKKKAVS